MSEQEASPPDPVVPLEYQDRGCVLVGCGVITIGMGLLCAGCVVLVILFLLAARGPMPGGSQISVSTMLPSMIFYGIGMLLGLTLGIGSVLQRRWARSLILALAWIMLVTGIVTLAAMAMLPLDMIDRIMETSPGPTPPPQVIAVMKIATGIAMLAFYIILPLAYILAYGSRHVRATCEARDPRERWTDRAPLPVLALSLISVGSAVGMLTMPLVGVGIPTFGQLTGGLAGYGISVTLAVIWMLLAVGQFRRSALAWAGTIVMTVLGGASAILTFDKVSVLDLYRQMGTFPEAQLDAMERSGVMELFYMPAWIGIIVVAYLGYVVLIRHYFLRSEAVTVQED